MSERIKDYRLPNNLCTILGFNPDEVKAIHLYVSLKGELWFKVIRTETEPQALVEEEVESWYKANYQDEQEFPLSEKDAGLKKTSYKFIGHIYTFVDGIVKEDNE